MMRFASDVQTRQCKDAGVEPTVPRSNVLKWYCTSTTVPPVLCNSDAASIVQD